jgi:arginyl-tRNA synthetase
MKRAHQHLVTALTEALRSLGSAQPRVLLEKPRDPSHGDVASNAAMTHAKELGQTPRAVAETLLRRVALDRDLIESAEIAGPGFINFRFAVPYLQSIAAITLRDADHFGESDELADRRILIEFVSANPSGPLNVVSARAAAVGDSLVRMFRARGATCEAEFYVNDAGNQVRLLGESVRARYEEACGSAVAIPEGGYHGEYLIELARSIKQSHGDRFRKLPSEDAARELGRLAVQHFVDEQRGALRDFRVEFNRWFFEDELRAQNAEWQTLEELRQHQATFERDGAVYAATSRFGDSQDWVLVTSDGRPTYFLPDIAYHLNKYDRGYDHVINILGPDHHTFSSRMKAALRALGRDPEKLEVILLQQVTLLRNGDPVKMSKRAGQLIEMRELVEETGVDAARYFFLLRRTSTPLDFDIELAKRQTEENPVYYVQYAHARIESIFRKAGVGYPESEVDLRPLTAPEELDLLRRLRELRDVLAETTGGRDPHGMTVWLRDVATQFHKFYERCRVLTEPAELQAARLALCRATQIALQKGLGLCGVSAPREM